MTQLIEVRVLGRLRVRRPGGETVDPRVWRTAKTRDLVRLLAVAGRPVPVDRVIDAFWPGVEPARGRGSLRTAASQVRQVLGEESLVRRGDALELAGAWVDATAFAARAASARDLLARDEVTAGLAAAWEAVALYGGDLCEDLSYADWVVEERDRLRRLLRQLLLDAAAAACSVGWWRDALELGHQALEVDACAEPAYRTLMRAYAAVGDSGQALRLYDRCRVSLAEQLGADPDEDTQALHLQLLRHERPQRRAAAPAPLVGRAPLLGQVRAVAEDVAAEERACVLLVTGPTGTGRTRLLQEAAAAWPGRLVAAPSAPRAAGPGRLLGDLARAVGLPPAGAPQSVDDLRALLGEGPVLVVLDDVHGADAASLDVLGALLRREPSLPLLVLASAPDGLPPGSPLCVPGLVPLELPALVREEVAELLTSVLQGPPSRRLVDELSASSQGRPGALLAEVQGLLDSGQLRSTTDGMVRVPRPDGAGAAPAAGPLLAAARERVAVPGPAVLDLLAVLDRPTTLPELCRVSGAACPDVQRALDQLCDLQVVVRRPTGYALADARVREAAYRWVRPSISRELHRQVAERAHLPSAARVEHWLGAGEPALACAAALQAADEAAAVGDDAQQRTHLRAVHALAQQHGADGEEQVLLGQRLAEVALRLGRCEEAREALEQAVAVARSSAPAALPRLQEALTRCAPTTDRTSPGWVASVSAQERTDPLPRPRRGLVAVDEGAAGTPEGGDVEVQVEERVQRARAAALRRDVRAASRWATEAMDLASDAHDDALFVRGALALAQVPALLGDGLRYVELLRRVRGLSGRAGSPWSLDLTWCLVLHDLGRAEVEQTLRQLPDPAGDPEQELWQALLHVHVRLERDEPRRARQVLERVPAPAVHGVADDAVGLLRARLLLAEGDRDGATDALRSLLAERPPGPGLLAPEAGARLAVLLAATDPAAAHGYLDGARALTGERAFPREQVLMLRASAELLAAEGNACGGATVALAAAMTASRAGLVLHEAEARARHQHLLAAAGRHTSHDTALVLPLPGQPVRPVARQRA